MSASILALTLLASCPTLPSDSLDLVPETATLVVGGEVDRMAATKLGQALVRGLEGDLQIGEAIELLSECGLAIDRFGEVWLARDAGEGRLLSVHADALGEPETLACVATQLASRDRGRAPWTSTSTSDCTTLELQGGSKAWLIGDDRLIWAQGPMIATIEQGAIKPGTLVAGVDRRAHAWLAATLDRPSLAVEARSLVAAIDLEREGRAGAWIDFTMTADDLAATATLRDRLLGLVARFADRLDALEIRHRLRERFRVGVVDGELVGSLELDMNELEQIREGMAGAGLF